MHWGTTACRQLMSKPRDRILTLMCDQAFMLVSLGVLLLHNEQHVATPFLDPDENNVCWQWLATTIESFFRLESPIAVPQVPTQSSAGLTGENDDG